MCQSSIQSDNSIESYIKPIPSHPWWECKKLLVYEKLETENYELLLNAYRVTETRQNDIVILDAGNMHNIQGIFFIFLAHFMLYEFFCFIKIGLLKILVDKIRTFFPRYISSYFWRILYRWIRTWVQKCPTTSNSWDKWGFIGQKSWFWQFLSHCSRTCKSLSVFLCKST